MKKLHHIIAAILLCALATGGFATEEDNAANIPWGTDTYKGLITRLVPTKDRFKAGEPISFRLEMRNTANEPVLYDDQGVAWRDNVRVTGPDGKTRPFFGSIGQSVGGDRPLAAGATVVIFDNRDLSSDYTISPNKTGQYTFQFAGSTFLNMRIPASNKVQVTIAGGKPNLVYDVLNKLRAGLDERWEISRTTEPDIRRVPGRKRNGEIHKAHLMHNPTDLKADVVYFDLFHIAENLQPHQAAHLGLGKPFYSGDYGHLYLKANHGAAERFPHIEKTITGLLR